MIKKGETMAIVIVTFISMLMINVSTEKHNRQTYNCQTVKDAVFLVKDNNVLIKNDPLTILFNGTAEETNQKKELLNKQVYEIAICDDEENTITIFIK